MIRKATLSLTTLLIPTSLFAASLNLSGNARFGSNLLNNLDLASGTPRGGGNTTAFWEYRFLVRPDIVVDDHFTLKSEVSLLQSTPAGANNVPSNFGTTLDGRQSVLAGSQTINLRRAWLEWASDWGVLRVGRQPKTWGLGILYGGNPDPWLDINSSTVDRVGFQAMVGNLVLNTGYEKPSEGAVNDEHDDAETYELSLEFTDPEALMDVGLLYSRNVRLASAALGHRSSNDLSIFSKKRIGQVQVSGEFSSISEDGAGVTSGLLGTLDYVPSQWSFALDFGLSVPNDTGSFVFHPSYRPFMLLFAQDLGPSKPLNSVRGGFSDSLGVGGAVAEGTGRGALLTKVTARRDFSGKTNTIESSLGFARLMRQGTNAGTSLGTEWDTLFTQRFYDNFKMSYGLGFLFPGAAFGANPQVSWGFQLRGALTF